MGSSQNDPRCEKCGRMDCRCTTAAEPVKHPLPGIPRAHYENSFAQKLADARREGWSEGYKHGLWQGQNCAKPAATGKPVAEVRMAHESFGFVLLGDLPPDGTRLYATPQPTPALVPLTDEQALEIAVTATPPGSVASRHQIVEAIRLAERHHGIFPSKESPL